jgi:hypothetical protein
MKMQGGLRTQLPKRNKEEMASRWEVQAETCDQLLEQLVKRLLAGSKVSTPL